MKLDFVRKNYSNLNIENARYFWAAYVNDYRIFGMKPYGINSIYESFCLTDGAYNIEIWRTLRKKETGYRIIYSFKINGIPVGIRRYIFEYPENCLQKVETFTADIKDVKI